MEAKDTEKGKKRLPYWKKYLFTVSVYSFIALTVFFFGPMETYLGNVIEFAFPLTQVWWILLVTALGVAFVLAIPVSFFSRKVLTVLNAGAFAAGLCFYIQSMFLNTQMGSLTGELDVYDTGLVVKNLAVWGIIFVIVYLAVYLVSKYFKKKYVRYGFMAVSCALIVMQLTGFLSLWFTTDKVEGTKDNYFSAEGEYELAKQNNVIYFIIDTCDGYFVNLALEKYPDMFDNLTGFTYYPNATSTHSRTFPSVPYLLTGEMCYFDVPYMEYVDNAHANSTFIEDIKAAGTDIRLFTSSNYISANVRENIDNFTTYDSNSLSALNVGGLIKQSVKISAYRGAPYLVKARFQYTADVVNSKILVLPADYSVYEDDYKFYQDLQAQGVTVNEAYDGAFRFYHMWGTHPGYKINENVELNPGDFEDALRGDIKIIEEYIAQMKEQGIYDSSTIIITADHGSSAASDDLLLPFETRPIMLVKPAGADSEMPIQTSDAPVCHEDLFATVMIGVGGDATDYGTPIYDIEEDAQRDRYYYHTALYSDEDGEVALREYLIQGDARDFANWHLTGKYWDVIYSERAVSEARLGDVLESE